MSLFLKKFSRAIFPKTDQIMIQQAHALVRPTLSKQTQLAAARSLSPTHLRNMDGKAESELKRVNGRPFILSV